MTIQIWYHAHCMDGLGAAWAAHNHFKEDAGYIPVQYGEPHPEVGDGDEVFILDFSYPREVLTEIAEKAAWVTVIDHHKTAQQDLEGLELPNGCITFDMNHSGARLTWNRFRPYKTPPFLIDYIEDRDLWKWELPYTREVSAWLGSKNWSITELYDAADLLDENLEGVTEYGKIILNYKSLLVDRIAEKAFMTNLAGYEVPCVYSSIFQSELGNKLAKGHPFAAVIAVPSSTEEWVSLRSAEDGVDVSVIAKQFGGGGHKHAAGFKRVLS